MKNVKSANYVQINDRVLKVLEKKGVEILPVREAWEKIKSIRKYFKKPPKCGYYVKVKKSIQFPLVLCMLISKERFKQELDNLLIVEENVECNIYATCSSVFTDLCALHKAGGKIILKKGSKVNYFHFHRWGSYDKVLTNYQIILERGSSLSYLYKCTLAPQNLELKTSITAGEGSNVHTRVILDARGGISKAMEHILLKKRASAISEYRVVGRDGANVEIEGKIEALENSKGHLDCRGLILDSDSKISLSPVLVNRSKDAILTHEASIGKIFDEQILYLKARGLSEEEAINLIVTGFLHA